MKRALLVASVLLSFSACQRMEATRHFNHGVEHYKAKRFQDAIHSFELARDQLSDPTIVYNLALSQLAHVRQLAGEEATLGTLPQRW